MSQPDSIVSQASTEWDILDPRVPWSDSPIQQTKNSLSAEDGQKFIDLFLAFTWADPPSVPETQVALRAVFGSNSTLVSRFSSFLDHPSNSPTACAAARIEFGNVLGITMFDIPSPIPGRTVEDFLAAFETKLGRPAVDRFAHEYCLGPRNTSQGKPTRPQLIELLEDDQELLERFEIFWPKEKVLEARLEQADLLKKIVDAIKDLVQDCNFDCNDSGVALQAMDNSHVALVSMMLKAESFSPYRCDRNVALGLNLTSLTKVLRAAGNEDILTIKAEDAPDVLNLVFESSESDRLSEYDLKLMDIDQEHLGIPDTEYAATISMPSSEFKRICMDLMALSESVSIEASKDGVKFSCAGDIGNGAVTLRPHNNVEKPETNVEIELTEPVSLTFSLKYLVNFCKASGLSKSVKLCLSNEVPLLVEYNLAGNSYLRFYLAPKIGDDE